MLKGCVVIVVLLVILAIISCCCVLPVAFALGCDPDLPGSTDKNCSVEGGFTGMFRFGINSISSANP